jgi:hypothetical protein
MRTRLWLLAFISLLFVSMALPSTVQSVTARTPALETTAIECPADTTPDDTELQLPPVDVVREHVDPNQHELADGAVLIYGVSTICLSADITVLVNGTDPIQQFGIGTLIVLEGSLTIELVAPCSGTGCAEAEGSLTIGTVDSSNAVNWTTVGAGVQVTLSPGDLVILENVTVWITTGHEGARVGATGVFSFRPGGGCPGSCWQYP